MPKGKMKFRAEPVRTAPCDGGVRTIQKIYRQFEKVSGGADGGVAGFNGSIRPKCLAQVLRALSVEDNELVILGQDQDEFSFLLLWKELLGRMGTSCQKTRE